MKGRTGNTIVEHKSTASETKRNMEKYLQTCLYRSGITQILYEVQTPTMELKLQRRAINENQREI